MIEKSVYEVLAASGPLVAVCPEILPWDTNIQNKPLPYIQHFEAASASLHHHGGLAAIEEYDYQVSVFAASIKQARAVADLAVAALNGVHQLNTSPVEGMTAFYRGERTLPPDLDRQVAQMDLIFTISYPRS